MMSYQHAPSMDETAAVPLGTPQPPTTMAGGRRLSKRMLAMIAGTTMLLMVAGGGTVWMMLPGGASYTTAAEGLVVATEKNICYPASGTFNGKSVADKYAGQQEPFETCFRLANTSIYCWTKSYRYNSYPYDFFQCNPNGPYGEHAWHTVGPHTMHPVDLDVPKLCGGPCQGQHGVDDDDH